MKVLKFGGTSVGTPESILKVMEIVASRDEATVVVVSALGGVTDQLIRSARLAEEGDPSFRDEIAAMRERHVSVCREVVPAGRRSEVEAELNIMLDRLSSICEGVFLLQVLPAKTLDEVVSFGERMSSQIISAAIPGTELLDSLAFIRTVARKGENVVDMDATFRLIRDAFGRSREAAAVVPGFIARDSVSGDITNLGRGGSDYTASLIAAALDAEQLEIWTDVDGFMTAELRRSHGALQLRREGHLSSDPLSRLRQGNSHPDQEHLQSRRSGNDGQARLLR